MMSSWQVAANSLFPRTTADNTVTNSRLDCQDDQTSLGRSHNLCKTKQLIKSRPVIKSNGSNSDVRILDKLMCM